LLPVGALLFIGAQLLGATTLEDLALHGVRVSRVGDGLVAA